MLERSGTRRGVLLSVNSAIRIYRSAPVIESCSLIRKQTARKFNVYTNHKGRDAFLIILDISGAIEAAQFVLWND